MGGGGGDVEGDEAERPWGQVGLYKNQNLTQRDGESLRDLSWEQWGRTQVVTGSLQLQCAEWPLGGEGQRQRGPGSRLLQSSR